MSSMEIQVSKYHGCGNDFIMTEASILKEWTEQERKDFIVSVCDRHTGIGADGCIFVKEDPLEMIYYNQDGSRADMCGNGIRCFAAYCRDEGIVTSDEYIVQTLAGPKTIKVLSDDPFTCQVGMGKPEWGNEKIGVLSEIKIWEYPMETSQGTITLYSLYMSTIHTVCFVEDALNPKWENVGEEIGKNSLYTAQTNVNFVEKTDDSHLKASTWERGCGPTLACGTGMCACGLVSSMLGKTGNSVDIEMKKGTLHIDVDEEQRVFLSGPAVRILKGTYFYFPEKQG